MIRGTTPTLCFKTPYEADMVESGYITFTMRGDITLDVPLSDESVSIGDNVISLTLTQSQTLSFDSQATTLVQLRLVLADKTAVASNIVNVPVGKVLKDGEI